jgi:hypothetical protein
MVYQTADAYGLRSEIAQTRGKLAHMQSSLAQSETAWAASGFAFMANPIATSLNIDISDHIAMLKRFERALAISQQ